MKIIHCVQHCVQAARVWSDVALCVRVLLSSSDTWNLDGARKEMTRNLLENNNSENKNTEITESLWTKEWANCINSTAKALNVDAYIEYNTSV